MKKQVLSLICIMSSVNAAEQPIIKREPREWNAAEYAQGNISQERAALHFLRESSIIVTDKKVLDVGCGTGNITTKLAEVAKRVHGIDASNNMIDYAKQHYGPGDRRNMSFEHCFAEDFTTQKKYNLALSFFCLHWIEDKQKAIQQINHALSSKGEFFGTHQSTSDPEPLHFTVLKNMIPGFATIYSFLKNFNLAKDLDYHVISDEVFKALLTDNGFEIVSYEQKSIDIVITEEDLENGIRPVLMSRPFMQSLPEAFQKWFFNKYVEENIKILKQDGNGNLVISKDLWGTKIFHARKVTEI
jgi:ubiquinone/menaquinone biosynthesis C-methylase UbiE